MREEGKCLFLLSYHVLPYIIRGSTNVLQIERATKVQLGLSHKIVLGAQNLKEKKSKKKTGEFICGKSFSK